MKTSKKVKVKYGKRSVLTDKLFIYVHPNTLKWVKKIAAKNNCSMSKLVNDILTGVRDPNGTDKKGPDVLFKGNC